MRRLNELSDIRHKRKYTRRRQTSLRSANARNNINEKVFLFQENGVNILKQLMQSDTEALSEKNYPPIVTDSECHQSYADTYHKLNPNNFLNRKVCCSCSLFVPSFVKPDIQIHCYLPSGIPNLHQLRMNIKPTHPQYQYHLDRCVYQGDPNNLLKGLLLDESGIEYSGTPLQLWLCSACLSDLSKNIIPSYSLANGSFIGKVPNNLPELTWMEEKVISRVRFNSCVLKLVESKLPSQKGFKGHLIARCHNPDLLLTFNMPQDINSICESMHIVLLDTKDEGRQLCLQRANNIFKVRRDVITKWRLFLQQHHPLYKNVIIDYDILQEYPEEGPPPAIQQIISVVEDNNGRDVDAESTVTFDVNVYDAPLDSISQFQKSVIVDENGSTIPMAEIYEHIHEELKTAGQRLRPYEQAVSSSMSPNFNEESFEHPEGTIAMIAGTKLLQMTDPTFFPAAFPHLFPYAIGSPTVKRHKLSFNGIVQHLLSSNNGRRLRSSFLFLISCYNIILKRQVFKSIFLKVKTMLPQEHAAIAHITPDDIEKVIANRKEGCFSDDSDIRHLDRILSLVGSKAPFSQLSKKINKQELKSYTISRRTGVLYITISPDDTKHILSYVFCLKNPELFNPDSEEISIISIFVLDRLLKIQ